MHSTSSTRSNASSDSSSSSSASSSSSLPRHNSSAEVNNGKRFSVTPPHSNGRRIKPVRIAVSAPGSGHGSPVAGSQQHRLYPQRAAVMAAATDNNSQFRQNGSSEKNNANHSNQISPLHQLLQQQQQLNARQSLMQGAQHNNSGSNQQYQSEQQYQQNNNSQNEGNNSLQHAPRVPIRNNAPSQQQQRNVQDMYQQQQQIIQRQNNAQSVMSYQQQQQQPMPPKSLSPQIAPRTHQKQSSSIQQHQLSHQGLDKTAGHAVATTAPAFVPVSAANPSTSASLLVQVVRPTLKHDQQYYVHLHMRAPKERWRELMPQQKGRKQAQPDIVNEREEDRAIQFTRMQLVMNEPQIMLGMTPGKYDFRIQCWPFGMMSELKTFTHEFTAGSSTLLTVYVHGFFPVGAVNAEIRCDMHRLSAMTAQHTAVMLKAASKRAEEVESKRKIRTAMRSIICLS